METKDIHKTIQSIFQPFEQPQFPDLSTLLTPFKNLNENGKPQFLYGGTEVIPFKERLPEFQEIFIHEFLTEYLIPIEIIE
jgi:hypothetical protein